MPFSVVSRGSSADAVPTAFVDDADEGRTVPGESEKAGIAPENRTTPIQIRHEQVCLLQRDAVHIDGPLLGLGRVVLEDDDEFLERAEIADEEVVEKNHEAGP